MPTNEAMQALKDASEGLLYESETDEPFTVFQGKADGELTKDKVLKRARKGPKTPVEDLSLPDFFQDLTDEPYRKLRQVIEKNLSGVKVFKVGERNLSVFI